MQRAAQAATAWSKKSAVPSTSSRTPTPATSLLLDAAMTPSISGASGDHTPSLITARRRRQTIRSTPSAVPAITATFGHEARTQWPP